MGLCSGKGIANVRNSDKIGLLVLYLNKTQVLLFIFAMFDKNINLKKFRCNVPFIPEIYYIYLCCTHKIQEDQMIS